MNKGFVWTMIALFIIIMSVATISFNLGVRQERQYSDWKSAQYDEIQENVYNFCQNQRVVPIIPVPNININK